MPGLLRILFLSLLLNVVADSPAGSTGETLNIHTHRQVVRSLLFPITPSDVRKALSEVVASYEAKGYLSVSVNVVGGVITDSHSSFEIDVVPGPLFILQDIRIESDNGRLQSYKKTLFGNQSGTIMTASLRQRLVSRSDRSLTWRRVGMPEYRQMSGTERIDAVLRFRPLPAFGLRLKGGIGFGMQSAVSGDGDLIARRLFAIDDQLQLNVHRAGNDRYLRSEYAAIISLLDCEKLAGWIMSRDHIERFSEIEGGLGIESFSGGSSSFGIDIRLAQVTSTEQAGSLLRSSLGLFGTTNVQAIQKRFQTSFSWRVDYLSRAAKTVAKTVDSIGRTISSDNVQGVIEFHTRVLLKRLVEITMYLKAETRVTGTADLPESELLPVGGQESLRGYRDQQFLAENALIVQLEPTIRQGNSDLFLFGDLGYLELPRLDVPSGNSASVKRFEFGYGLGARLNDGHRTLIFGLGWSREAPLGEPRLFVELAETL